MADTALFSTAEARAFDKAQLANETTYTTAAITAKEVEIRDWLDDALGLNCIRTTHTAELHDGDGSDYLMLDWPEVSSVTAISVDGVALTSDEINATDYEEGLAVDSAHGIITRRCGIFDRGWRNVSVTYVAGFEDVPKLIKRAALMIAVTEMLKSNVAYDADEYDAGGGMTTNFGRGDGFNGNWHRIPEVVKAIRLYSRKLPGIA